MVIKRFWWKILIISFVSIITIVGCKDDDSTEEIENGEGTKGIFTLTNIPSQYNGEIAFFELENGIMIYDGYQDYLDDPAIISNGSVNIPLWIFECDHDYFDNCDCEPRRYYGNDTFTIGVNNINEIYVGINNGPDISFNSITFNNGSATKKWSDGIVQN